MPFLRESPTLETPERHMDPISRNEVWGGAWSLAACTCRKRKHSSVSKQLSQRWPCHKLTGLMSKQQDRRWRTRAHSHLPSKVMKTQVQLGPVRRKTEGRPTAHTRPTLTNSGAGDSRGLWQDVKWLPGRVGSGWTANPAVSRPSALFSPWWISFQGTRMQIRKWVAETARGREWFKTSASERNPKRGEGEGTGPSVVEMIVGW